MTGKNLFVIAAALGSLLIGQDRRAVADDWPGWRNDGSGISTEADVPLDWSADRNIRWKTPVPGKGHSSPIVWGDQVIVTTVRPTVDRHWLSPAALIAISLLCTLALWRLTNGTFADPLGNDSNTWSSESRGASWLRRMLAWLLFLVVGYGTIIAVELAYDIVEKYPQSLRDRVIDKTWYFTDAPGYEELDTPISAFRVLSGQEVEGPFFGAPRIPLSCYYGGVLAMFSVLAWNSTMARRRRLVAGLPTSGQDETPPIRLFRFRINVLGLGISFGIRAESPLHRIVRSMVDWLGCLAAACFLVTVHSAAMADLPFAPGGTTWFLTVAVSVVGLMAFNLTLPARPLLRVAGIIVTAILMAWLIGAAPVNEEFGIYATAQRAGLRPLVKLFLVVLVVGVLAAWIAPLKPARLCGVAERHRRWTAGLAATALLLAAGIYFALANFWLPHSVYAREIVSVDRASGEVQWTARCDAGEINSRLHAANTMATPTPVTDGEHVFAHFGEAGLFCLDMNGNRKWKYDEPVQPAHWGAASSPVLWRDLVIMTYDTDHQSMTVGIDKATGEERWRSNRTSQIDPAQLYDGYSTPIIIQRNGEDELVHLACKLLVGYDPATGKERWSFAHPGEQPVATPVKSGDLLFILGGEYTPYMAAVRINPANGSNVSEMIWQASSSLSDMPSPVVYDGLLYMVNKNGIATCIDAGTGEYKWRHRLDGAFWSSVTAADGKLYFCNASGTTTVIAAGPEYKELSVNELGEDVYASFAVSRGEIFIRTSDHLICVSANGQ